jgi:hypothetical protein
VSLGAAEMTRFRLVYPYTHMVSVVTLKGLAFLYFHFNQDVWKRFGEGSQLRSFFLVLAKSYHAPKATGAPKQGQQSGRRGQL